MPQFMNSSKKDDSKAETPSSLLISRQNTIEQGVAAFNELGMNHICKVCIANSGSCCHDCLHLRDGIGCQKRNTSCTAWLCGFHKYFLYEIDQLKHWNEYWKQIPGQQYREDFTPEMVKLKQPLHMDTLNVEHLAEELAYDLQEIAHTHLTRGFILTLREKLDNNIDQLLDGDYDDKKRAVLRRKIKVLSSPLYRFQSALADYRESRSHTIN